MTAHPRAKEITFDIEATGLLDDTTIDYTAIPYKLKDNFQIHVICVEEWSTEDNKSRILCFYDGPTFVFDGQAIPYTLHKQSGESTLHTLEGYTPVEYEHYPLSKFKSYVEKSLAEGRIRRVWGHNEINYDLLACDLVFDMPYDTDQMTWCGLKHGGFDDTLVRSKVQNADRLGGHSLDNLSKIAAVGDNSAVTKYDFRPWLSGVEKFKDFGPDMVYYNILDVKSNTNVARYLLKEAGDWDWAPALHLERVVAEIVTRQTHRGFFFNAKQAQDNLEFLDKALADRDAIITPLIPTKPSTKSHQKDFTPPKKQFNKDGSLSALMQKFANKIGANLTPEALEYQGVTYPLPLVPDVFVEAVAGSVKASIDDSTHIKGWLVSEHGWVPSEWKERDLSLDTKRRKLAREKVVEAVDRYVAQTQNSPFKAHRLEYLGCEEDQLRNKLLSVKDGKPIRVRTNPSLTVGQEKEVDPALAELQDRFPHAKSLIEYYTFKHRRNAILGGGMEYDEEEGFADAEKGFMSAVRADGRIPTPADTCGAATGRMKHKIVCNIPRGTSLFGGQMRGMFCVDKNDPVYQLGYDFSSLEAGMEAHYCWKYDEQGKPYCNSLLQSKPNDVHTKTASKISELIGKAFIRDAAKSVKYGVSYGAQPAKVAKIVGSDLATGQAVFDAFWEAAKPLALLKEDLTKQWEKTGKKYIVGLDGRKIPTRAAHSIINSLFQSGGAISAKRVMVEAWREYKKRGWDVDFFRQDWRQTPFVQQMIAMHDEAQAEVSKSLVTWKKFASAEEAKMFRQEQKALGIYWSESTHPRPDGSVFLGYSEPTQILWECVNKVSKDLKLHVPLAIEFVFGMSWQECH